MDSLVPPPETVVTPKMEKTEKTEEMEWESIIKEKDAEGLTDQELKLQKDKEEVLHLCSRNKQGIRE